MLRKDEKDGGEADVGQVVLRLPGQEALEVDPGVGDVLGVGPEGGEDRDAPEDPGPGPGGVTEVIDLDPDPDGLTEGDLEVGEADVGLGPPLDLNPGGLDIDLPLGQLLKEKLADPQISGVLIVSRVYLGQLGTRSILRTLVLPP